MLCKALLKMDEPRIRPKANFATDCSKDDAISLIVRGRMLKFGRTCDWYCQKYGHDAGQTPWRKLHLLIDVEMNVHSVAFTEDNVFHEAGLQADEHSGGINFKTSPRPVRKNISSSKQVPFASVIV
jgi:hypothetical protein